jgi:hypothetical protein
MQAENARFIKGVGPLWGAFNTAEMRKYLAVALAQL